MRGCHGSGGVFGLVRRHGEFDDRLLEVVKRQDARLVANCATPESRRLYDMQRAVMRCLQAKKGFMRLRKAMGKVLYARTELEHDVLDLLVRHFHHRFPTYHVAIESGGRTQWVGPDGALTEESAPVEEVVRRIEAGRSHEEGAFMSEDVWRQYYDSQRIPERENPGLQRKMMPMRYRDEGAWESIAALRSRCLADFI
jgi:probable DNA metabolism protein